MIMTDMPDAERLVAMLDVFCPGWWPLGKV